MKKRINNLTLIFVTVFLIFCVIIVTSTIKITNTHNEKLLYSMQTKIEYYAKRCYLENKCENKTTLKHLYENNYLQEVVNPVTKEILDENLSITFFNNQVIIDWEN